MLQGTTFLASQVTQAEVVCLGPKMLKVYLDWHSETVIITIMQSQKFNDCAFLCPESPFMAFLWPSTVIAPPVG